MKQIKLVLISLLLSTQILAFDEFLVSDIRIIGLQRVSTGSIFNVIPISVGDKIDSRKSNDIVKSLFSTEQFDDIQIGKDGNTLIITVTERPSISAIDISGNKALKTEQLMESLDGVGIKEGEVYKRSTLEKVKSEEEKNVIFDKNSNLKRLLSESFPNKKILITDNKDGSQTILIH